MTELQRTSEQPIVPHRAMKHLVLDIQKKFLSLRKAYQTLADRRIQLGLDLLEARARVEAGEEGDVTWWEWFESKFTQSRRDAERVMQIASAENPQGAYKAGRNCSRNRGNRNFVFVARNRTGGKAAHGADAGGIASHGAAGLRQMSPSCLTYHVRSPTPGRERYGTGQYRALELAGPLVPSQAPQTSSSTRV